MPQLVAPTRFSPEKSDSYKLAQEIVALSVADTWDAAKLEWEVDTVYFHRFGTCLCGHYPIYEHCIIKNQRNQQTAIVGNCCVKRFLGLPSDKLFSCINRIYADISRALNAETIDYAHRKGWITAWEYQFCFDTMRKRKLSPKQLTIREGINRTILCCMRIDRECE